MGENGNGNDNGKTTHSVYIREDQIKWIRTLKSWKLSPWLEEALDRVKGGELPLIWEENR